MNQLVFPDSHRKTAIQVIHNDAGHQGKEKTRSLQNRDFFAKHGKKEVDRTT